MPQLPTYEEAILGPEVIDLVRPYMDGKSLALSSRVCEKWYAILNPYLWESPIQILAKNKYPFASIYNFMTKMQTIPPSRTKTTLHNILDLDFTLPATNQSPTYKKDLQIYENVLTTQFISKYTTYLPNLRFLNIQTLKIREDQSPLWQKDHPPTRPKQVILLSSFGQMSLNSCCIGASDTFSNLMFLDISYTHRTVDFTRVFSTNTFSNLRILKLKGLRLTDSLLPKIVWSTGHKLWSLDLRDNLLTDQAIEILIDNCIRKPITHPTPAIYTLSDNNLFDNPPKYQLHSTDDDPSLNKDIIPNRPDTASSFKTYLLEHALLTQTTRPILDEKEILLRQTGLTHLYLSSNKFTSSGIQHLLTHTNLQTLNIGSFRALTPKIPYTNSLCLTSTPPITGTRLENLRIHHSLITHIPTITPSSTTNHYSPTHLLHAETTLPLSSALIPFSPQTNNRIHTLTLTSIPTKSHGPILLHFKTFISQCAEQERVLLAAKRRMEHHRSPPLLTGLRVLRLEFLGAEERGGDEQFLAASVGDFSFFDDEAGGSGGNSRSKKEAPKEELFDIITELKIFRKTMVKRWSGRLELVAPPV